MIRINLVPRDEARRQATRQRDRQIAVAIVAVLAVTVVTGEVITRRSSRAVEKESTEFQTELVELTKRYQDTVLLEKKRKELEAKLKTIAILERQRRGPVRVLADLGEATPEKLWLTEMRESGGSMLLSGKGLDNQTIALFMRNLQRSSYFATVDLVETKQVEDGQAKLKEFSIRTSVLYAGRRPPAEEGTADASKAKAEARAEAGSEVKS